MVDESTAKRESNYIELTAAIIAAFVEHNAISRDALPALIADVHATLQSLNGEPIALTQPKPIPAVPIKKSIKRDHLICLECGNHFTSLKRHLAVKYGLTPDQYRAKWKLPSGYPMNAPSYSEFRSSLAKTYGLGTIG